MRVFVSKYGYVGGFYGGCNEALMRAALLKYGPLSVGIEVGEDFFHYKGGIYHKTGEIVRCCLSRLSKDSQPVRTLEAVSLPQFCYS